MRTTDIRSELQRLFDARDPARGGTVVIWHDPEGEFAETVDALELPGIEVAHERPGRLLALKRALNEDLSGRRILLYRRRSRRLDGDWLADIEARSPSFAADYASVQLRELGAADTADMRAVLRAHKAFFAKKTNIKKVSRLAEGYDAPARLEVAVMAAALGAEEATAPAVLRAYLSAAEAEGGAEALGVLAAVGAADSFKAAVSAWTGFAGDVTDAIALAQHVLVSALAMQLPPDALGPLAPCCSVEHAPFCHALVQEWARGPQRGDLLALCGAVEESLGLERVLADVELSALSQADTFPCIDAIILRRLFAAMSAGADGVDEALALAAARRGSVWYANLPMFYEGVSAAASMRRFFRDHRHDPADGGPAQVWRDYTRTWYRMDRWYRDLHSALARAITRGEYELDEDFRDCCAAMEDLYKNWYLRGLARRWTHACADDFARLGYAGGVPRQVDFDMAEVEPMMRTNRRAWVIVSDALRYEVATELAEVLERETRGVCELDAVQAAFPSITKCGMTALLPASSFTMAEEREGGRPALAVYADGAEAPTCAAREAAIRRRYPDGAAIRYDDFINAMDRAQRLARVGEAPVVYVYHNTIDAYGDKPATERKVFTGCREAIEELVACVQTIVRDFKAARIVLTADHGFLYTAEALAESEHAAVSDVHGAVVEAGRRYVVARGRATSDPFVNVALPVPGASADEGDDGALTGFAPRECVRIRMAGGGENYVHGGISLQELCVPVLRFTNKRAGTRGYVESAPVGISLVSQIDVISNTLFNLEFLQDEPASGKMLPATYEVFVGDAARTPVSDTVRIVADRADEDATARVFRASMSLKPGVQTSEREQYHLFARNIGTGEVRSLHDLRIRVSFAPSIDFGW